MSTLRAQTDTSWHRIEALKLRLRMGVQISRQHSRGERWFVLEDPTSVRYHRLSWSAYAFVALLDGKRTVGQAQAIAAERLGDPAPTQREAMQILGQLSTAGLLAGDISADAESSLRRTQKRKAREWQGRLRGFLFSRIPIVDPSRVLRAITPVCGLAFTALGGLVAAILLVVGPVRIVGDWSAFVGQAQSALAPSGIPWFFTVFVVLKLIHELAHGVACVRMARREGAASGGRVHEMGILLMVLMPVPYVDASSAWMLRSRWRRTVVNAAGMYAEIILAAIAAIIWASSAEGSTLRTACWYAVVTGGVTTLVFNANPLLRYDGYYILSDALGVANLQQRATDAMKYPFKRFLFGVRGIIAPAESTLGWLGLIGYGVASMLYRIVLISTIIWFISGKFFFIGSLLAVIAIGVYGVWPIVELVRYLASGSELRSRTRASMVCAALAVGVVITVGLVPMGRVVRVPGVVESTRTNAYFAPEGGWIRSIAQRGAVVAAGDRVVVLENLTIALEITAIQSRIDENVVRRNTMLQDDPQRAQILTERIAALEKQLENTQHRAELMAFIAPFDGVWVSQIPEARTVGAYAQPGDRLGMIVSRDAQVVRIVGEPYAVGGLGVGSEVEVMHWRGSAPMPGVVLSLDSSGSERLETPALAESAGGPYAVTPTDDGGLTLDRPLLAATVQFDSLEPHALGERVWVRGVTGREPIAQQAWRAFSRALQRRVRVTP
jgi:putative peptide zinc metalloprotease protein